MCACVCVCAHVFRLEHNGISQSDWSITGTLFRVETSLRPRIPHLEYPPIKIPLLHRACAMDNVHCNGIGYYKCKHARCYNLNTVTFMI